jgi:hypothetical protein
MSLLYLFGGIRFTSRLDVFWARPRQDMRSNVKNNDPRLIEPIGAE